MAGLPGPPPLRAAMFHGGGPSHAYMGMARQQDPYHASRHGGCPPALCAVVGVGVGCAALAVVGLAALARGGPPLDGLRSLLHPGAGGAAPDIAALADQVGDDNAEQRGAGGNPFRDAVQGVFAGTATSGGDFGPVTLSARAAALRAELVRRGFQGATYYHGTNLVVSSLILEQGFLFSDRRFDYGHGIYVAETMAHAECYTGGDGSPIIEVEVLFRPEDRERFIKFVPSNSEADDVYIVRDPLAIFPVTVHECCEVEEFCM